jgi:hypothetical protein
MNGLGFIEDVSYRFLVSCQAATLVFVPESGKYDFHSKYICTNLGAPMFIICSFPAEVMHIYSLRCASIGTPDIEGQTSMITQKVRQ